MFKWASGDKTKKKSFNRLERICLKTQAKKPQCPQEYCKNRNWN